MPDMSIAAVNPVDCEVSYESFSPSSGGAIATSYTSRDGYRVRAHCMVTDAGWREFLSAHRGYTVQFDLYTKNCLVAAGFELATN